MGEGYILMYIRPQIILSMIRHFLTDRYIPAYRAVVFANSTDVQQYIVTE